MSPETANQREYSPENGGSSNGVAPLGPQEWTATPPRTSETASLVSDAVSDVLSSVFTQWQWEEIEKIIRKTYSGFIKKHPNHRNFLWQSIISKIQVSSDSFLKTLEGLTEGEMRFVSAFFPEDRTNTEEVVKRYVESKTNLLHRHEETWERIAKAVRNNPSAVLIFGKTYNLENHQGDSVERLLQEIESLARFSTMVGSPLNGDTLWQISYFIEEIAKFRWKTIAEVWQSGDFEYFRLLSRYSPNRIFEFVHALRSDIGNLPGIPELENLLCQTEAIVYARPYLNEFDGTVHGSCRAILKYFLGNRNLAESRPPLEIFLDRHASAKSLKVLEHMVSPCEANWHENPIYDIPVPFISEKDIWKLEVDHEIRLCISLGHLWLEAWECDNFFKKLKSSRDLTEAVNRVVGFGNSSDPFEKTTLLRLVAIIRNLPKSFHKILRILLLTSLHPDSFFIEREWMTIGEYLQSVPWNLLSDEAFSLMAQEEGKGSYADFVREKCDFLGADPTAYAKLVAGFYRAAKIYPDMRSNLSKFARFERGLFEIEVLCMNARVQGYFIEKLEWKGDLPISFIESETGNTLIRILITNSTNLKLGKELLGQMLVRWKDGSERSRFRDNRNEVWLEKNLDPGQSEIWLSRNERAYRIDGQFRKTDSTVRKESETFLLVARGLLESAGIGSEMDTSSPEAFAEGLPRFLESVSDIDPKLSEDLRLQAYSVERILRRNEYRSVSSVKVYRETDPLRVGMMGDWVDGSCLASLSPVGNSWSVIANACEANKAVLYAEDEKGNVIGRVLLAIDQERKFVVFPVYRKGNPDVDLEEIFRAYLLEFAQKTGLSFGGLPEEVEAILWASWYRDPVWVIG